MEADPVRFSQQFCKDGKDPQEYVKTLQGDIAKLLLHTEEGDTTSTTQVQYYYIYDTLGRRYTQSPAFQTLDGGLRKLIAAEFYWDLDFANAYPVIITNISRQLGMTGGTPILDQYTSPKTDSSWLFCTRYPSPSSDRHCSRVGSQQRALRWRSG
eukprot:COSAG02_NODE_16882_length_1047_cov_18.109705_2_plen_155_part_00